jgi:hypothetical protein
MQIKPHLVFIIIGILLTSWLLVNFLNGDFATSVIPGWHTTIIPPYTFFFGILPIVFAFCMAVFYSILSRNKVFVPGWLVYLHLTLSLPYLLNSFLNLRSEFIYLAIVVLFIVGQLLFLTSLLALTFIKVKTLKN